MSLDFESAKNFFNWAEIEKDGVIEVNYLLWDGKKYDNGRRKYWNKVPESIGMPDNCLLCVGVNPRPKGLQGSSKDTDIKIYKNLYIDIEPIHPAGTTCTIEDREKCYEFANGVMNGFSVDDLWSKIVQAESGNGMHLLIAIPPYDNPQEFANKMQVFYKTVLLPQSKKVKYAELCRIDSTFSASRQVKLYGTKKPVAGSRVSSFPSVARVESSAFRDYILSFPEKERKQVSVSFDGTQLDLAGIEEKYGFVR